MRCERIRGLLDDYVDGLLSEAACHEVEAHLGECEACRNEDAELRALLDGAASLDRELPPPRDLWPDIEARIAAERKESVSRRPVSPRWRFRMSLAAAAVAIIAVAAVVLHRQKPSSVIPTAPGTLSVADYDRENDAMIVAARSYVAATAELTAAWEGRRDEFSPETQTVIDENLRIIDDSLRELNEAIRQDPSRFELRRLLVAAHQKKVGTLQMLLRVDVPPSRADWRDRKLKPYSEEEKS
jgi:hypothetical protein